MKEKMQKKHLQSKCAQCGNHNNCRFSGFIFANRPLRIDWDVGVDRKREVGPNSRPRYEPYVWKLQRVVKKPLDIRSNEVTIVVPHREEEEEVPPQWDVIATEAIHEVTLEVLLLLTLTIAEDDTLVHLIMLAEDDTLVHHHQYHHTISQRDKMSITIHHHQHYQHSTLHYCHIHRYNNNTHRHHNTIMSKCITSMMVSFWTFLLNKQMETME